MIKLSNNLATLVKRSASSAGDYALYGGGGALAGAGLGGLINYLRGKSVGKGALIGGGLGGAAGLGTRGVMDLLAKSAPAAAEGEGPVSSLPTRYQSQSDRDTIAGLESILPHLSQERANRIHAEIVKRKTAPTLTPRELNKIDELTARLAAAASGEESNAIAREIVNLRVGR